MVVILLPPVEEVYPWEDGLNLKHSLRKPCTIWKDEEDGKTPKKKLRVAKKKLMESSLDDC